MRAFAWYDHLTRKIGFGDGEEEPVEAVEVRILLCDILNAALAKIDPAKARRARLVPYDRMGAHNRLMVEWSDPTTGQSVPPPAYIHDLLDRLDDDGANLIDRCVEIRVTRHPHATEYIANWVSNLDADSDQE